MMLVLVLLCGNETLADVSALVGDVQPGLSISHMYTVRGPYNGVLSWMQKLHT